MPQELTIDEQLILAKKLEKALKDRTEQIQAALQQSQNELEAATAKREAIEAKLVRHHAQRHKPARTMVIILRH
jgi:hypothetical protein